MPHLMTWKPLTFFAVTIAGWMNLQQQEVISYLRIENQILREKLGHKRIILNESQKRRLATAAMKMGKDLLRQFATLFSPDTLIRWHRWLVARKYDSSDSRGKRGPVPDEFSLMTTVQPCSSSHEFTSLWRFDKRIGVKRLREHPPHVFRTNHLTNSSASFTLPALVQYVAFSGLSSRCMSLT